MAASEVTRVLPSRRLSDQLRDSRLGLALHPVRAEEGQRQGQRAREASQADRQAVRAADQDCFSSQATKVGLIKEGTRTTEDT